MNMLPARHTDALYMDSVVIVCLNYVLCKLVFYSMCWHYVTFLFSVFRLNHIRLFTNRICLENPEMSGNLTAVREMPRNRLKVRERILSGKTIYC